MGHSRPISSPFISINQYTWHVQIIIWRIWRMVPGTQQKPVVCNLLPTKQFVKFLILAQFIKSGCSTAEPNMINNKQSLRFVLIRSGFLPDLQQLNSIIVKLQSQAQDQELTLLLQITTTRRRTTIRRTTTRRTPT